MESRERPKTEKGVSGSWVAVCRIITFYVLFIQIMLMLPCRDEIEKLWTGFWVVRWGQLTAVMKRRMFFFDDRQAKGWR